MMWPFSPVFDLASTFNGRIVAKPWPEFDRGLICACAPLLWRRSPVIPHFGSFPVRCIGSFCRRLVFNLLEVDATKVALLKMLITRDIWAHVPTCTDDLYLFHCVWLAGWLLGWHMTIWQICKSRCTVVLRIAKHQMRSSEYK